MRGVAVIAAALMVAVAAIGCGDDDNGADQTGAKSTASAGETYKIGVVLPSEASNFHERMKKGIDAAAAELDNVELDYSRGSQIAPNPADQTKGINTVLTRQPDAIIVGDAFPATKPPLERALRQGIPVVFADADLTGLSPERASLAATDNVAAGKLAAEYIAKTFGKGTKVGLLDGLPTIAINYARTNEAAKTLPSHGIEIAGRLSTGCTVDGGVKAAQNLLTAHPEITVLYSACGPPTVGAATVIRRLGLTEKVKLIGFDASDPEIEMIEAGRQVASVSQLPEREGYEALKAAVHALKTKQIAKSVTTPTIIVTKDNTKTFLENALPKK